MGAFLDPERICKPHFQFCNFQIQGKLEGKKINEFKDLVADLPGFRMQLIGRIPKEI